MRQRLQESLLSTLGTIGTPKIIVFFWKIPNGLWLPPPTFRNCSFGQGLNGRLFSPMHWQCIGIPLVTGLAIIVLLHSQSWREDWNGWCFKVSNFQYYDPFEFLRTFTAISLIFWASQLSSNVIQFNSIQFYQRLCGKNVCTDWLKFAFDAGFPCFAVFHQQCDSKAKVLQELFTFFASSMAMVTLKSIDFSDSESGYKKNKKDQE